MANLSLTGKLDVKISINVKNTLVDAQPVTATLGTSLKTSLTSGVSLNQANRCFEDYNRELASGANEVIDLYDFAGLDMGAGAGADALGQAITMEEIVLLYIKHEDGDGLLSIEADATNGWTPIGEWTVANGNALREGGCMLMFQPAEQGFNVTDASSHRIKVTASSGDVTYSIVVVGRHDDDDSSSTSSLSSSSSSSSSTSTLTSSSSVSSLSSSSTSSLSSSSSSSTSSLSSSSSSSP